MDWIEASVRMAGLAEQPRRDRRYHRSGSRIPTKSVELAGALGWRNARRLQGADIAGCQASASAASRQPDPFVLLFPVALAGRRSWNLRQAPARVNLLVGRTLGWRGAIGHRNLSGTFQPHLRGSAGDGIRRLFWVARLLARHGSHSFDCRVVAAAQTRQSSNAVRRATARSAYRTSLAPPARRGAS